MTSRACRTTIAAIEPRPRTAARVLVVGALGRSTTHSAITLGAHSRYDPSTHTSLIHPSAWAVAVAPTAKAVNMPTRNTRPIAPMTPLITVVRAAIATIALGS